MIRLAKKSDLKDIIRTYDIARQFMINSGNPTQWPQNYPSKSLLADDIKKGQLFVIEENSQIHGVFAFIIGIDPTYNYIENGQWINDEPYGAIHRIASSGKENGIFKQAVDYCKSQIPHLRIDTHKDNKIMQHLIEKHGFKKCGTIYVLTNSPRIAYEYVAK